MKTGNLFAAGAMGAVTAGFTAALGPIGTLIGMGFGSLIEGDPFKDMDESDMPRFNFKYNPNTGKWGTMTDKGYWLNNQYPNEFLTKYTEGLNIASDMGKTAIKELGLQPPNDTYRITSSGTTVSLFDNEGYSQTNQSAGNYPYLYSSQTQAAKGDSRNLYSLPSPEQLMQTLNSVPYEMVYSAAKNDPNYQKAIAAYESSLTGSPERGYGTQSSPSDKYDTSIAAGKANLTATASTENRDLKGLVDFLNNWDGDTTAWDSRNKDIEDRYSSGIDVLQGTYKPTEGNPDWSQERELYQMKQTYKIPEGYTLDYMINYYRRQAAVEMGIYDQMFTADGRYNGPEDWLL